MVQFFKFIFQNRAALIVFILFVLSTLWWIFLHMSGASSQALQLWAASYQVIAWYGAILGLIISKRWGGWGSAMGRCVLAFSIGLFLQGFGQSSYSFYIYYLNTDVPYPSIGDVGYFGSVLMYIYAVVVLMRVVGSKIALGTYKGKIMAAVLPLILLSVSYWLFLQEYEFDWSQSMKIFLDFGYPLGQAFYLSLAILAFFFSRNILGGKMHMPIFYLLFALCAQYIADFVFLLQASWGTWSAGGINDFVYSISYFLMSVSLIYIGFIYRDISEN